LTDHRAGAIRGLDDAATHFAITRAVDAGALHPTREYLAWRDAMAHAGAAYAQVRQSDALHLDETSTVTVLAPPQALYPSQQGVTTASNDLILRLDTPGLRALLLGAADSYALDALAGSGQSLSADVVELALVPGETLDLSGALGDVLFKAHPRLVVICNAPVEPDSATARQTRVAGISVDKVTYDAAALPSRSHKPSRCNSWRASKPNSSRSIWRPARSTISRSISMHSALVRGSVSKGMCWANRSIAC
jgi:hypothetical protein